MHWVREARPMLDRKRHLARVGAAIVAAIMEKNCQIYARALTYVFPNTYLFRMVVHDNII